MSSVTTTNTMPFEKQLGQQSSQMSLESDTNFPLFPEKDEPPTRYDTRMQTQTHMATHFPLVHMGIRCHFCNVQPIVGVRYKCMNCMDFNMCLKCETSRSHEHDARHCLLKIKINTEFPANPTEIRFKMDDSFSASGMGSGSGSGAGGPEVVISPFAFTTTSQIPKSSLSLSKVANMPSMRQLLAESTKKNYPEYVPGQSAISSMMDADTMAKSKTGQVTQFQFGLGSGFETKNSNSFERDFKTEKSSHPSLHDDFRPDSSIPRSTFSLSSPLPSYLTSTIASQMAPPTSFPNIGLDQFGNSFSHNSSTSTSTSDSSSMNTTMSIE